jgi:hypothetical protein
MRGGVAPAIGPPLLEHASPVHDIVRGGCESIDVVSRFARFSSRIPPGLTEVKRGRRHARNREGRFRFRYESIRIA